MARVHKVEKSAKSHQCGRGHEIPKGEPYLWAKPGFRTRTPSIRCVRHPFRASELTTSLRSGPLAAQEAFDDALSEIDQTAAEALDELTSALEEFQNEVRDYADQRRESADAWEYGNEQLEELADLAEQAADELEGFEVEEWDGDEDARVTDPGDEPDDTESTEYTEWEDASEAHEEAVQSWADHVEEQFNEASEISAGLEF
jgi:methyl-accepting chemotaxis protein